MTMFPWVWNRWDVTFWAFKTVGRSTDINQQLKKILKNQNFVLASDNHPLHYIYITRPRGVFKFGMALFRKPVAFDILQWIVLLHRTKGIA
jgi:hypothetical protein